MKNKFLLLGATALLSAGALIANANTSNDLDLDVKVNIVVTQAAQKISDIDFATIILGAAGDQLRVSMNPQSGVITSTDTALSQSFVGTPQNGQFELTYYNDNPFTFDIPAVQLTNENGDEITYTPSSVELTSQAVGTSFTKKTYGVGGTLTSGEDAVEHGLFTGKITITTMAVQ